MRWRLGSGRRWFGGLVALACVVAAFDAFAEPAKAAEPASPSATLVERYRLANGLRVVLAPDRVTAGVSLVVRYDVGAAHEPRAYRGMSHVLEHLTFRGSRHLAPLQGVAILQRLGARFNATTELEATRYFAQASAPALETLLWLESERMAFTLDGLAEPGLEVEKRVVENELRQRAGTQRRLESLWLRALYGEQHPFAPGEDEIDDVRAASLAGLQWFFQSTYRPDNATLVLVGKFELAEARRLLDKYFAPIQSPPVPRLTVQAPAPRLCGVHRLGVRHDALFGHWLRLAWSLPVPANALERVSVEALAQLLDRRLTSLLVEGGADVAGVNVAVREFTTHHQLVVSLELHDKATAPPVEQVVLREARSLAAQQVDPRALRTVRANLLSRSVFAREDGLRRALLLSSGRDLEQEASALRLLHPARVLQVAKPLAGPLLIGRAWPGEERGGKLSVEEDVNPCP